MSRVFFIGFTLFAMFFGAGNLIFPPNLGWASGGTFSWAILGFVVTGVGLPLLAVIAGSFSSDGYRSEAGRVHPWFGMVFLLVIYLTIGPFFAIPRTATTAYEMGVVPQLENAGSIHLLLFTIGYFLLTFVLSVRPNTIVDTIGKVLTPLLLLTIVALIIRAFFVYSDPVTTIAPTFNPNTPFANGFLDGYKTMDALAAVAFVTVVVKAIRMSGTTDAKKVFKESMTAAVVAGVCLAIVYISLGWVGNHFPMTVEAAHSLEAADRDLGVYILTVAARATYGAVGQILLGTIVFLACLTTSIGLVVAISTFFYENFPRFSYKTYAIIFTLFSLGLANQGLSQVIQGSIPVLLIVYPVAIVLIGLVFVDKALKGVSDLCFQLPIYTTVIISVLSVVAPNFIAFLPYVDIQMQWLLPAVCMFFVGLVFSKVTGAKRGV